MFGAQVIFSTRLVASLWEFSSNASDTFSNSLLVPVINAAKKSSSGSPLVFSAKLVCGGGWPLLPRVAHQECSHEPQVWSGNSFGRGD
jgi:hypothetical protein